jgi:hypothetical protein
MRGDALKPTWHILMMIHDSVQAQEQQLIQQHPKHTAIHPHTTVDITKEHPQLSTQHVLAGQSCDETLRPSSTHPQQQ